MSNVRLSKTQLAVLEQAVNNSYLVRSRDWRRPTLNVLLKAGFISSDPLGIHYLTRAGLAAYIAATDKPVTAERGEDIQR